MTTTARMALCLLAVTALSAEARAAASIDAYGIVTWNNTVASLSDGSSGISQVNRVADGEIEVVFSAAGYQSLKSTVLVSCRHAVPCSIAWDSFNANSVRVRSWEASGAPSPNGSFSIILVQAKSGAAPPKKTTRPK